MLRGKFYLVPMPIGNDQDITLRAIDQLSKADYILAEDTRVSKIILSKYDIKSPLISYHLHNERERVEQIIDLLEQGHDIALISDAGMPLISDPGYKIVKDLIQENFQIVALPGANAGLTALIASGLNTEQFTFIGFIPAKGAERKQQISELKEIKQTVILYEAPHRLIKTLADLIDYGMGKRLVTLGRELTKKYESYLYSDVESALIHYQQEEPRGEFVLILEGKDDFMKRDETANQLARESELDIITNDIKVLLAGGIKAKPLSQYLASKMNFNKNEIYQLILKIKEESDSNKLDR